MPTRHCGARKTGRLFGEPRDSRLGVGIRLEQEHVGGWLAGECVVSDKPFIEYALLLKTVCGER